MGDATVDAAAALDELELGSFLDSLATAAGYLIAAGSVALPALIDLTSRVQIGCAAGQNNLTTTPLPDGAPTSLPCGSSEAEPAPPPPVPIVGDFGAPLPEIVLALSDDPDDADAVLSEGDTITLTFGRPTDMGGYQVGGDPHTLTRNPNPEP